MSSSIMAMALNLDDVLELMGSGDEGFVDELIEQIGDELESEEEFIAEEAEGMEMDEFITVQDAIRQMVNGDEYVSYYTCAYEAGFETMCSFFAEWLSNDHWSPIHYTWPKKVDKALASLGIDRKKLSMDRLFNRSPVKIPFVGTTVGYLKGEEVDEALAAFPEELLEKVDDKQVRESLAQVRDWLQICSDTDRDLICFYN